MIPIADFLANPKAVLMLGAGASMDYGFPSWCKLQQLLLSKVDSTSVGDPWTEGLVYNDETLQDIHELIAGAVGDTTIDDQIERNRNAVPSAERAFRRLVSSVIAESEKLDLEGNGGHGTWGWIEEFADRIVQVAVEAAIKPDFLKTGFTPNVVTFNYDRVFEYHFFDGPYFADQHYGLRAGLEKACGPSDWERYGASFIRPIVYHPHGAIGAWPTGPGTPTVSAHGFANINNTMSLMYGDTDRVEQMWVKAPASPFVYPVDSFDDPDVVRPTYAKSQALIAGADILMIGLSPEGQRNQKLDLSRANSITVSNALDEYGAEGPSAVLGCASIECLGLRAREVIAAMP